MAGAAALACPAAGWNSLPGVAATHQESNPLEHGKPVERELLGGQTHAYQVVLKVDQYLRVMVEQKGIDVAMTLFGPDEAKLAEIIFPHTLQGRKVIIAVTAAAGNHRLEVRSQKKDAAAGKYEVQLLDLREATAEDRTRVAIRKLVAAAMNLRLQGTAESLNRSIEKLQQTLPLIRSIRDRYGESEALGNLGAAYFTLSQFFRTDITLMKADWQRGETLSTPPQVRGRLAIALQRSVNNEKE